MGEMRDVESLAIRLASLIPHSGAYNWVAGGNLISVLPHHSLSSSPDIAKLVPEMRSLYSFSHFHRESMHYFTLLPLCLKKYSIYI